MLLIMNFWACPVGCTTGSCVLGVVYIAAAYALLSVRVGQCGPWPCELACACGCWDVRPDTADTCVLYTGKLHAPRLIVLLCTGVSTPQLLLAAVDAVCGALAGSLCAVWGLLCRCLADDPSYSVSDMQYYGNSPYVYGARMLSQESSGGVMPVCSSAWFAIPISHRAGLVCMCSLVAHAEGGSSVLTVEA